MKMRALLVVAAASTVVAQNIIDYTKIPQCARQCTILDQAEKNCVPATGVVDQAQFQSCFCQSGLLTSLHSSGALCQPACNAEDAPKITEYYNALCNAPVVQPPPQGNAPTTTTTTTGTSTAGAAPARFKRPEEKPWIETHWKWVIMVVVIFIAIVTTWIGGIYLRRHFDRKAAARRANLAADDAAYNSNHPSGPGLGPSMSDGKVIESPQPSVTVLPPAAEKRLSYTERLRSRSSTLSMGLSGSTKANTPQPVVWGPHQHLAVNRHSNSNSPGPSGPPSPSLGVTPPQGPWKNRDSLKSDHRFSSYGSYRGTQTSLAVDEKSAYGAASSADSIEPVHSYERTQRPQSTRSVCGEPVRDVKRQTLSSVKSDPAMQAQVEAQSALIEGPPTASAMPHKLQKSRSRGA